MGGVFVFLGRQKETDRKQRSGAYLPQLFYAMLAQLTLFGVLSLINLPSAIVLLVCVPMIPVTIILIQRWAKKLLSKYWGQ